MALCSLNLSNISYKLRLCFHGFLFNGLFQYDEGILNHSQASYLLRLQVLMHTSPMSSLGKPLNKLFSVSVK